MHPADCPTWEYDNLPQKDQVLRQRTAEILIRLRRGTLSTLESASDSRPVHQSLFVQLTPLGYEYYAGHYRGEDYRCLRYCEVGVGGDPSVGFPAHSVLLCMHDLARSIRSGVGALDAANALPNAQVPVRRHYFEKGQIGA